MSGLNQRKLTRAKADELRAMHAAGASRRACASHFRISLSQVDRTINGENWVGRPYRHLKLSASALARTRAMLAAGVTISAVARHERVSRTLISLINSGKRRAA